MANRYKCVLEDNLDIQDIVKMIFYEEGYEVDVFSTIAAFESGVIDLMPDLFLLDVMLPDGNGLDVCERLKSNPDTGNIPVLIMTANSGIEKMQKESSADAFIQKPFDIDVLSALVAKLSVK